MRKSKSEIIRNHYIPRVNKSLENYQILDWASSEGQQLRFEQLLKYADLENKSILDVGCGLADLPVFISSKNIPFNYVGVDLLPEMVTLAKEKYPAGRYLVADIFSESKDSILDKIGLDSLDIIYCSGALNLNLGNNDDFVKNALLKMTELASESVIVTMLHARADVIEDEYYAYYPSDIIKIVKPVCRDIFIADDYLYNDFTLICQC